MTTQTAPDADLTWFADRFESVAGNIERVIQGKRDVIDLIILTMLSEGHALTEDVPGVDLTRQQPIGYGDEAVAARLARLDVVAEPAELLDVLPDRCP